MYVLLVYDADREYVERVYGPFSNAHDAERSDRAMDKFRWQQVMRVDK